MFGVRKKWLENSQAFFLFFVKREISRSSGTTCTLCSQDTQQKWEVASSVLFWNGRRHCRNAALQFQNQTIWLFGLR